MHEQYCDHDAQNLQDIQAAVGARKYGKGGAIPVEDKDLVPLMRKLMTFHVESETSLAGEQRFIALA